MAVKSLLHTHHVSLQLLGAVALFFQWLALYKTQRKRRSLKTKDTDTKGTGLPAKYFNLRARSGELSTNLELPLTPMKG